MEIQNFITINSAGVITATYPEIKSALIDMYKDAYGSDIDLTNGNSDDVFISNLSLIINNILRSFDVLYANLDVNSASGIYLDALCRLSNVIRKSASASTTKATIKANVTTTINYDTSFVDESGNEWTYSGDAFSLTSGNTANVLLTCQTLGPIALAKDSLSSVITQLTLISNEAAVLGNNVETDSELRGRRANAVGAAGTTVLESLSGALLSLAYVDDVYVYENNSNVSVTLADGATVAPHSIYVVTRQTMSNNASTNQIAKTIFQKLTPGIGTNAGSSMSGTPKSVTAYSINDSNALYSNAHDIQWKLATGIHPKITISLIAQGYSDSVKDVLLSSFASYLNALPIGTDLVPDQLISELYQDDPLFNGRSTFIIKSVSVDSANVKTKIYSNPLTYYNYTIAATDIEIVIASS